MTTARQYSQVQSDRERVSRVQLPNGHAPAEFVRRLTYQPRRGSPRPPFVYPGAMPLNLNIPPDAVAGKYADFASLWHTDNVFVFDFAVMTTPPQAVDPDTEPLVNAEVVARIRMAPPQIFELMKALEQQLTKWELETGQRNPGSGPSDG